MRTVVITDPPRAAIEEAGTLGGGTSGRSSARPGPVRASAAPR